MEEGRQITLFKAEKEPEDVLKILWYKPKKKQQLVGALKQQAISPVLCVGKLKCVYMGWQSQPIV